MAKSLLYLLGGSAAFEVSAEAFVLATGGADATIALLMQGGVKSQKYISEYTQPWIRRGVKRYNVRENLSEQSKQK